MNEWLERRADVLSRATGVERHALELDEREVDTLLDLAGYAAHESGARTNAPLVCYLLGRAAAGGSSVEELAEIIRSTS